MADVALTCSAVSASYGSIRVCHSIDLELPAKSVTTLLGANGAGKSSFFRAIAGEINSSGDVTMGRSRLTGYPVYQRSRQGLAFVPEGRRNCFFAMSVADNIAVRADLTRNGRKAAREGVEMVYDIFPVLKERRTQAAGTLSGGEQQMLAIGMAIVGRPQVLLLDEPSQGLAPVMLNQLREAFRDLRKLGMAIYVAEQNVQFAMDIADDYTVMQRGRIVEKGATKDLDREALAAQYL